LACFDAWLNVHLTADERHDGGVPVRDESLAVAPVPLGGVSEAAE
jgi:hypothetical protein